MLKYLRYIIPDVISNIEEQPMGLSTGFMELDNYTRGLKPSDYILIAGRPSMGKTSLATDIALGLGTTSPVLFFSVEMTAESIVERMIGNLAGVNMHQFRTGGVYGNADVRVQKASKELHNRMIIFDDSAGITPTHMANTLAQVNLALEESGESVKCMIVDYLQLMASDERISDRQQEITMMSRQLKTLAKDTRIPLIVLSQLNRNAEYRQNHRPMLSDLRESGSLEQDCDTCLLVYREGYYCEEKSGHAELIVAKNRFGPTGTINCVYNTDLCRFEDFDIADF
jgi:replicative DNA helicase